MIENKPIMSCVIGYIIGIILGLYCECSIVFLYLILIIIYLITNKAKKKEFKLISFKRYSRYLKIIFTKKVILIIISFSIISNSIILYQTNKYQKFYNQFKDQDLIINAEVISNEKEKNNKKVFKIKIIDINGNKKFKNSFLLLQMKKNRNIDLEYGDKAQIKGKYLEPQSQRNYKGFDYKQYLKTLKIKGTINSSDVKIYGKSKFSLLKLSNSISLKTKDLIKQNFKKSTANVLIGLVLGDTNDIDDNIKSNFKESNISYILAISGMHVGYITICTKFILDKLIGKRKSKIFTSIIIIIYMFITGFSPSVVRAGIMAIITVLSGIFYRKSDKWNNISLALLLLLIYNPFLITSTSLLLSFIGTIGIIVMKKDIKLITISATLFVMPLNAICFNKIAISSLIISIIVGFIIGPIIILGFIFIICFKLLTLLKLKNIYIQVLSLTLKILIFISKIGSRLPLNKIYVTTPTVLEIIAYYSLILIGRYLYNLYHKDSLSISEKRVKNLLSLAKFKYRENKKKVISIVLIICLIITSFKIIPKDLKIYFIDVGQGDSTLIITPYNKKILIDGGGSELGNFSVGENTLVPYLLDRKIKTIDYLIISHFDTDHVDGLLTVMEDLKVKKVIICKQGEINDNLKKFKQIVKNKKIKIQVVDKKDRLRIDKDSYFDILWPDSKNLISENILNNNSIVCKFNYKSFSMLFTGDIEKKAEKQILEEYKNNLNILSSTVLKVGHHGSKTSSTMEFLEAVKPRIALIGVGENNTFGHPNEDVIERIKKSGTKIYRTDQNGEISIIVNNKNKIRIKEFIE